MQFPEKRRQRHARKYPMRKITPEDPVTRQLLLADMQTLPFFPRSVIKTRTTFLSPVVSDRADKIELLGTTCLKLKGWLYG